MTPCHVLEIETPKKVRLNGLWFGPRKPKRVIVFIHGLTASAFSMGHVVRAFADNSTAVVTFNNRGFEKVAEVKRERGKKAKWIPGGAAHEVFTDCVDDVQGAVNVARRSGAKKVFIAGHSTGAQKAVYWAYKKKARGVRGLILLGPLSDYAAVRKEYTPRRLKAALLHATKLVRRGKPHELMPQDMTGWMLCDAQRFLSLYTKDSAEQRIFSYFDEKLKPRALESVRVPVLAVFAANDEHADRPAAAIAAWFEKHLRNKASRTLIVPNVRHNLKGAEKRVAMKVKKWLS